ncbi:MAG: outer membrane lipoprotein-sorting protein [bacterium]|nr:outer membrane lipoprotein-sorting protein [bacterium]
MSNYSYSFFKLLVKPFIVLALFLVIASPAWAGLSANKIVQKSYDIEDGRDAKAIMKMKIVKARGKVKKRNLSFYRKDYGRNSRTLIVFRSPADVKGTSFLTWNNRNRSNDQWLYLPALNRVKRIPQGDKSKSFMGSDFSFEDLSKRSLNKDTYKKMREETVDGADCYVIQATAKARKEKIKKRIFWINKSNFIIIKAEQFDRSGKLLKRLTTKKIKKVNNIWTIHYSKMENVKKKKYTILTLSKVKYNTRISARKFSKSSMKR